MKPALREELFTRWAKANPNPTTELIYDSAFQLLAAVLLSAQSTDVGVNAATRGLFRIAPTPEAMVALGEARIADAIRTIGLYRTKARNLLRTSQLLLERHGGQVPGDREALEALPGVGRKTANVILNTWFGQPVMAVDTHIFRLANRLGLAPGADVRTVETGLDRAVPRRFQLNAHHWLILHGRYVCKARRPECWRCNVRDLCPWEPKSPSPP